MMKSSALLLPLLAFLAVVEQAHANSRRSFAPVQYPGFAPRTANRRSQSSHYSNRPSGLEFLESETDKINEVQQVNVSEPGDV